MSESVLSTAESQDESVQPPIVVVDLGKQKRARIKKLRKGEGKLMESIQSVIDDLRSDGTVADGAQAVVIVVQEKDESLYSLSRLIR